MGVITYISPNKMSKEAKLVLEDLKSKVSYADVVLEELNLNIDEINDKKNEINTFIANADERVETILNTVVEELEVTQSDIDSILEMVGDL